MKERPLDPASGQSEATISAFLRNCVEGDEVAIRHTQGYGLRVVITKITGTNPKAGRIYTATPGGAGGGLAWYLKSGKNCFHPKGQSRLIEPTPAAREFAADFKSGAAVRGQISIETGLPLVNEAEMDAIRAKYLPGYPYVAPI